jgi:hypothetical protein
LQLHGVAEQPMAEQPDEHRHLNVFLKSVFCFDEKLDVPTLDSCFIRAFVIKKL